VSVWKPAERRISKVRACRTMNEPGRCLAASEILTYLNGDEHEARRAEVEGHLDECRLCQEAVEGVGGLEWREGFLRSTDTVLARLRSRTDEAVMAAALTRRTASRLRPAPRYLTLAASLAVAVGAAIYLNRTGPAEALFLRHFDPYPSTQPIVRGTTRDDKAGALARYEARDYRGALGAFEGELARDPTDPSTLFYAGLSRLALAQTTEAARDLEQVIRLGKGELEAPAEWYLALAHLRSKDFAAARSRLERIAGGEGFYRDQARSLLSEVERLDRPN
jgi:hypothetical protein